MAALAALVVLAACGGDDDEPTATRRSTTTSATATDDTTTTSAPTPSCPEVVEPADATDRATVTGDVDGDQRADELISYRDGSGAWHLQVRLGAGGGAGLAVPSPGDTSVQVLGGADVDGDGAAELWARTGAGASAAIVGLARLTDCRLERITFATREPAEFPVGGTVGTAAGLQCRAGSAGSVLTSYTATNMGDDRYEVVAQEWKLDGTTLVSGTSTTTTVAATDGLLGRASSFSCGDLAL